MNKISSFPIALVCWLAAGCSHQAHTSHEEPKAIQEERNQQATQEDLEILEQADAMLFNEAIWNRHDNRKCPPGQASLSLFCALYTASIKVLGQYDHRRVALQEVRFAIEDVSKGSEFEHRLMDFNNLSTTSFVDIKKVLSIARKSVGGRLTKPLRMR